MSATDRRADRDDEELEARLVALEGEVQALRLAVHPTVTSDNYIPGFGVIGRFADDPTFAEAASLDVDRSRAHDGQE